MNRHLGCQLGGFDVLSMSWVACGLTNPPPILAIVVAIWSSLTGSVVPAGTAVFGEVGLGGEVRPVVGSALRVGEASKLGFSRAVGPW